MGGFFGITSKTDAVADTFFGTDYHTHLGTTHGGIASYDKEIGLQRKIHNIKNSPFRTKFDHILAEMQGTSAIGTISDTYPQPLLIHSHLGTYAICTVGIVNNMETLTEKLISQKGVHFDSMTGGKTNALELISLLIDSQKDFASGIEYAQNAIEGTASILILKEDGSIIAARDKVGRIPVIIGKNENGHCVTMESFVSGKLDYENVKELGPGEIVHITPDSMEVLRKPGKKKRVCSFLWSYYGYPTSTYEGINVEMMRYRNGKIMALNDMKSGDIDSVDYIGGVPDSGTPHAIGFSNTCGKPFARAFIKYTPTWSRSFISTDQSARKKIAKMKQIPVLDLIKDKNLLFVDDSIVRGTQLKETVEFLYENGAKSVHMRSACPPIMFGCKFLNFTRATSDMELISRRVIMELEGEEGFKHIDEYGDPDTERGKKLRDTICKQLNFDSLKFQSLKGVIEAIGLPEEDLCTYCWNGKE